MIQYTIAHVFVKDLTEETAEIICAKLTNEGFEGIEIKQESISSTIVKQ
jgi:hypothetical protein